jgi:hypothetical protein
VANFSLGEAVLGTSADISGLDRDLNRAEKRTSSWLSGLARNIAVGVGVAIGAGVAAIGVATGKTIALGSDAEEMMGKFNVVFGDFAETTIQKLDAFGAAVGRGKFELRGMAASVQDTFVPLGFARDRAAEMSVELTKLAVDVASFNNVSDADTMRDFQSALVGNHETVRKYGIIITQAALDQELLNMGIAGGIKEATEQEKVMARMNLIMAGTSDAQGDAARTAGSWANVMRALKSSIKDTATEIGLKLLPLATPFLAWARDMAQEWGPKLVAVFGKWAEQLLPVVERVLPRIQEGFRGFVRGLEKGVFPVLEILGSLFKKIFQEIGAETFSLARLINGFFADWLGWEHPITQFFYRLIDPVHSFVRAIKAAFGLTELGEEDPPWALKLSAAVARVREAVMVAFDWITGTAIPFLLGKWEEVKTWFTTNGPLIREKVLTTWEAVKEWFAEHIQPIIDELLDQWEGVKDWFEENNPLVLENILSTWQEVKDWFEENQPELATLVDDIKTNMVEGFATMSEELAPYLQSLKDEFERFRLEMEATGEAGVTLMDIIRFIGGVINVFVTLIQSVLLAMGIVIAKTVEGFVRGMTYLNLALKSAENPIQWIALLLVGVLGLALSILLGILEGFIEATIKQWQFLYDRLVGNSIIPDLVNEMVNIFTGVDWLALGLSIIERIADGIRQGAAVVKDMALSVAQDALKAAADFLGFDLGGSGSASRVSIGAARQSSRTSNNTFNLTIKSNARSENIIKDFNTMRGLVGG